MHSEKKKCNVDELYNKSKLTKVRIENKVEKTMNFLRIAVLAPCKIIKIIIINNNHCMHMRMHYNYY